MSFLTLISFISGALASVALQSWHFGEYPVPCEDLLAKASSAVPAACLGNPWPSILMTVLGGLIVGFPIAMWSHARTNKS